MAYALRDRSTSAPREKRPRPVAVPPAPEPRPSPVIVNGWILERTNRGLVCFTAEGRIGQHLSLRARRVLQVRTLRLMVVLVETLPEGVGIGTLEPPNGRGAVGFVLSGGDPALLQDLVERAARILRPCDSRAPLRCVG